MCVCVWYCVYVYHYILFRPLSLSAIFCLCGRFFLSFCQFVTLHFSSDWHLFFVYVYLDVCHSLSVSFSLLSVCHFFRPCLPFFHLSMYLFAILSVCLSVYLPSFWSVCVSAIISVCVLLSVSPSVFHCLSVLDNHYLCTFLCCLISLSPLFFSLSVCNNIPL